MITRREFNGARDWFIGMSSPLIELAGWCFSIGFTFHCFKGGTDSGDSND